MVCRQRWSLNGSTSGAGREIIVVLRSKTSVQSSICRLRPNMMGRSNGSPEGCGHFLPIPWKTSTPCFDDWLSKYAQDNGDPVLLKVDKLLGELKSLGVDPSPFSARIAALEAEAPARQAP